MPFEVVRGVGRGMGVLDGGDDRIIFFRIWYIALLPQRRNKVCIKRLKMLNVINKHHYFMCDM